MFSLEIPSGKCPIIAIDGFIAFPSVKHTKKVSPLSKKLFFPVLFLFLLTLSCFRYLEQFLGSEL